MNRIKREWEDYQVLLRNVPGLILALFMASVVVMNLLANKELVSFEYLALDCGFTVSWMSFLCMDVLCKHFGAKAAAKLSILALFFNLVVCGLFHLVAMIPCHWGEFYATNAPAADAALDATLGGSWYIVFGSSLAMFASSVTNSLINAQIGKRLKHDNFKAFAIRSYVSTAIGQFVDNLVFAIVVSHVLFGWTWVQILACSAVAAMLELVCEIAFSPLGYRVTQSWKRHQVGAEYFAYRRGAVDSGQ